MTVAEKLNMFEEVLNNHSYQEVDGILVDVQSANAVLTVYEALGEANKEKFINEPIHRMMDIAWKLVNR